MRFYLHVDMHDIIDECPEHDVSLKTDPISQTIRRTFSNNYYMTTEVPIVIYVVVSKLTPRPVLSPSKNNADVVRKKVACWKPV